MTESLRKPHIAILGGGYAGLKVLQHLSKTLGASVDITIINNTAYLYNNSASTRAMVEPQSVPKLFIPIDSQLKYSNHRLLIGSIQDVPTPNSVVVVPSADTHDTWKQFQNKPNYSLDPNGDRIHLSFTHAVLALGSDYPFPGKADLRWGQEQVVAQYEQLYQKFQRAKKILVAGSGIVGAEYAGDLKTAFPDKEILLVGPELLKGEAPKLVKAVRATLEKLQIQLFFGEKLAGSWINSVNESNNKTSMTLTTDKGTVFHGVDLVVPAAGMSPRNGPLQTLNREFGIFDEHGWVKTSDTYQVVHSKGASGALSHLFVLGDISARQKVKLDFFAMSQAGDVSENITRMLSKKSLKTYKPFPEDNKITPLTIGPNSGHLYIPLGKTYGAVFGNWPMKILKGDGGISMVQKSFPVQTKS